MAENVNANIRIDLDSSEAVAGLKALQSQISSFNKAVVTSNAAAVAAQKSMMNTLIAQVGATHQFSTSIANVETSVGRLGKSIDRNKLSLGEYFKYGIAASGRFGRIFEKQQKEIVDLASDRVKRLQTQYLALGDAQNGMTKALAVRPLNLFNSDSAISIQRMQLFNKLLRDGSTSLINWGKNTQWAGRQLMVGFTVPLTIFGGMAGKIFMDLEKQIVKFRRVYGDATTPLEETNAMIAQIQELSKEYTKYGIAVSDTIALAGDAAAAGAQGEALIAATSQATRLATLGMIDQQQALTATIALQSAFRLSNEKLAESVNFLNAVENQTVVSLDDITQAIPLVAPVIQGLGGDIQDLAIFMAAMREGGVNASEGANALKSGLASLINPTKAAREQLNKVGIDIDTILSTNKGDLRGIVTEFGAALGTLDKFQRQQVLAKMFGKYQFARLGALFDNINRAGSQSQRVLELTAMSTQDLGALAEKELSAISESVGVKFTAAVERFKLAIAPIGETFLRIATPIIEFGTKLAEKFNELGPTAKQFTVILVTGLGVVIPTLVMVTGLFANFFGQIIKGLATFKNFISRLTGGSSALQYLSEEELDAAAASATLEGKVDSLTASLNVQKSAVKNLARAYSNYTDAALIAASNLPGGALRGPARRPRRMATGGIVPGSGNKDTVPALLTPGESVITKDATQKFAPILEAMNSGNIPGFNDGVTSVNLGSANGINLGNGRTVAIQASRSQTDFNAKLQRLLDDARVRDENSASMMRQVLTEVAETQRRQLEETGRVTRVTLQDIKRLMISAVGEEGETIRSRFIPRGGRTYKASGASVKESPQTAMTSIMGATEAQREMERARQAARGAEQAVNNYYAQLIANSRDDAARVEELERLRSAHLKEARTISRAHSVEVTNLEKTFSEGWAPALWRVQSQIENQLSNMLVDDATTFAIYERHLRGIESDTEVADAMLDKITRNLALSDNELQIQARVLRSILSSTQDMAMISGPSFGAYAAGTIGAAARRAPLGASSYYGGESHQAAEAEAIAAKEAAVQAWRGVWQINSPSEQGAGIGESINDGVAEGLRRSASRVTTAASTVGRQAVTSMKTSAYEQLDLFNQPIIGPTQLALFSEEQLSTKRVPKEDLMPEQQPAGGTPGGGGVIIATGEGGGGEDDPEKIKKDTKDIGDASDDADKKVGKLGKSIGGLTKGFGALSLVSGLALTPLMMMGGKVGELSMIIAPVLDVLSMGAFAFSAFGGSAGGAGAALAGFGTAAGAVAAPVAAIIAAIAALVASFVVAYKKFQFLRDAIADVGDAFKEFINNALGPIKENFASLQQVFDKVVSVLSGPISNALEIIGVAWTGVAKAVEIVIKIYTVFIGIFQILGKITASFIRRIIELREGTGLLSNIVKIALTPFFSLISAIKQFIKILPTIQQAVKTYLVDSLNNLIDVINMAIDGYNRLAEAFGVPIVARIDYVITTTGTGPRGAPGYKGLDPKYNMEGYVPMTPGSPGYTPEEVVPTDRGGGAPDLTWLEELMKEFEANSKLFLGKMKGFNTSFFGLVEQLRSGMRAGGKKVAPLPVQIIEMIGTGPEGLARAKELLNLSGRQLKSFINNWRNQMVGGVIETLKQSRDELRQKNAAGSILEAAGFTKDQTNAITSDAKVVATIVELAGKKGKKAKQELEELFNLLREINAEDVDPLEQARKALELMRKQFNLRPDIRTHKELINFYQKEIELVQEQINKLEKRNEADRRIIRGLERQKEMIQRQIDRLEKLNELDQRKIDSLKREDEIRNRVASALSRDLDIMSQQEQKIKEAYDNRVKALDKVVKLNDRITQQQRAQLQVSQALSQGDIFAATAAAQEMQGQNVGFAQEQSRAALEQGMQNQIAGLRTEGGLTRQQAEQQIADIKEQSYQTGLQIQIIEDAIYQRNLEMIPLKDAQYQLDLQIQGINDAIYNRETEILNIQSQQLDPLSEKLNTEQKLLKNKEDEFEAMADIYQATIDQMELNKDLQGQSGALLDTWWGIGDAIAEANRIMKQQLEAHSKGKPERGSYETLADYNAALGRFEQAEKDIIKRRDDRAAAEMEKGVNATKNAWSGNKKFAGGYIKKYAQGNYVLGSGGRDSIPAMLTPGEFVIRKAAVDKFGVPMLNSLNMGAMPKYNVPGRMFAGGSNTFDESGRRNNGVMMDSPVYNNYTVNVNVAGTNASADDIATRAITKIKEMQNMQIRGNRAY